MPRMDVMACLVRDGVKAMNGYRILIVDDDKASSDTLRRLFAHKGWVVTVATCVTEALTKLDPPPLCVLLDLMLPDGDGEEVLRKVRDEGLPTRVVVSTGTDDPVRLALAKGLDADAIFPKPIDFDEVCRACEDETIC